MAVMVRAKRYAIARFLPEDGKRAAIAAEYQLRELSGHRDVSYVVPRTVSGYCPLGIALRGHIDDRVLAPSSHVVAAWLDPMIESRRHRRLQLAAQRFINDWDGGKLRDSDLAAVFGVAD